MSHQWYDPAFQLSQIECVKIQGFHIIPLPMPRFGFKRLAQASLSREQFPPPLPKELCRIGFQHHKIIRVHVDCVKPAISPNMVKMPMAVDYHKRQPCNPAHQSMDIIRT